MLNDCDFFGYGGCGGLLVRNLTVFLNSYRSLSPPVQEIFD